MNSSAKLRILLDSTYILPILGVEVEGIDEALEVLRRLRRKEDVMFYYTEFNMLEILGKISRMDYEGARVSLGLSLVEKEFILIGPTVEGYLKALGLRKEGYKDLIDLLLYTTSLTRDLVFLTRDYPLIEFLEAVGERSENLLYERDLIARYK